MLAQIQKEGRWRWLVDKGKTCPLIALGKINTNNEIGRF